MEANTPSLNLKQEPVQRNSMMQYRLNISQPTIEEARIIAELLLKEKKPYTFEKLVSFRGMKRIRGDTRVREEYEKLVNPELSLWDQGWRFEICKRAKSRAGVCMHRKKLVKVSAWCFGSMADGKLEDTIRHEVAHAVAGPYAKHGPAWKNAALECGASPSRCYSKKVVDAEVYERNRPIAVVCCKCKKVIGRFTRRIRTEGRATMCCRDRFVLIDTRTQELP